ncbi:hypothetical protein ABZ154_10405 [Streptomyces sp. NPDC006261]|uniref:hypothetical protein n=1 Tax=Streptomyces sp. NPDC006261 TaxID=3156739 RepID=UPI0033B058D5
MRYCCAYDAWSVRGPEGLCHLALHGALLDRPRTDGSRTDKNRAGQPRADRPRARRLSAAAVGLPLLALLIGVAIGAAVQAVARHRPRAAPCVLPVVMAVAMASLLPQALAKRSPASRVDDVLTAGWSPRTPSRASGT